MGGFTRYAVRRAAVVAGAAAVALAGAGCGQDDAAQRAGSSSAAADAVRLGYFPNVTHATALVGLRDGHFQRALGPGVKVTTSTFNAGPAAVEALFSGAIDATYIGPSPTITAATRSKGEAVRVVAGATSGGAALVVKPELDTPEELKGRKIATPQRGNTQDVALRHWLRERGLSATREGGGDVSVVPQENAQSLETFTSGAIDGAWVPEPWATRLVQAGGRVLVDERTLWPEGKFVTTHLVVRAEFLRKNPDLVRRLVQGSVDANAAINADPAAAQRTVAAAIGDLTGKPLPAGVIAESWRSLTFTDDPLAPTLRTGAEHAAAVGLLEGGTQGLDSLYDLGPLNAVLREKNRPEVAAR